MPRPNGICVDLEEYGVPIAGTHISMWNIHAAGFILSSIVLISWARSKYNMKTTGFFDDDQLVIFPIHLDLLVLIGISALIQGVFLSIVEAEDVTTGKDRAYGDGICFGFSHMVIDGTTVLLLSPGIGRRALKRAAIGGTCIGIIIGFFKFVSSLEDEEISFDGIPMNTMVLIGDACYLGWLSLLGLFYVIIWLAPNVGYLKRRPAAIVWARFWALYNILLLIAEIFEELKIYACFCIYHFTIFFGFAVLKGWIAYQAFVLEALWWHGADVSGRTCYLLDCGGSEKNKTRWRAASAFASSLRESVTEDDQEDISSPFGGLELSSASAAAISDAIDGFGRARGDSLSDALKLEDGEEEDGRRSKRRATFFPTKKPHTLGSVPLIDFTRLKIIPRRLLGVGSTARVYEGRWCGHKVAVKVLFTVEIVPEEIKRICKEASLLFSLQTASKNVIRLFGVAVLPPSICVVLDLCSEGSLSDVLLKAEEVMPRSSSSLNIFRMGGAGSDLRASWRLSSSGHSISSMNSSFSKEMSEAGLDFAYKLTWGQLLDLALGAAKGVLAVVTALPGYSHNDIKSANFLVDCPERKNGEAFSGTETLVVKIADMEFASIGVTPDYMKRGDTPNWCAPEVLSGDSPVSPASDIYALACVFYEVAARTRPFGDLPAEEVAEMIKDGKKPEFPTLDVEFVAQSGDGARSNAAAFEVKSRLKFKALIEKGWAQDPTRRPSASTIVTELEFMKEEYLLQMSELREEHRLSGLRSSHKASSLIGVGAEVKYRSSKAVREKEADSLEQPQGEKGMLPESSPTDNEEEDKPSKGKGVSFRSTTQSGQYI